MPEIGLFPLPLVLLPTERVPLHVFEPRYRELVSECLAEGRELGVLLEDEQGRRQVGTRAAVVEVLEVFPDGRMNVVVEGRDRFRLVRLTQGRSFLTAQVERVTDAAEPPPTASEIGTARRLFRQLVEMAEADVDEPDGSSGSLSFELAARVGFGLAAKQGLLELRSERARLRRLAVLLEGAVAAVTRAREVRERATGNGRVSAG